MNKIVLGKRKMILACLQYNHVRKGNNPIRIEEQRQVLHLLLRRPQLLFSEKRLSKDQLKEYKQLNVLNARAMRKDLYISTKKMLRN